MITLARSSDLLIKEFRQFRKNYIRYRIQNGYLFRRNSKNIPSRRVIDNLEDKRKIIKQLHNVVGWLVAAPLFFSLFLMPRHEHT